MRETLQWNRARSSDTHAAETARLPDGGVAVRNSSAPDVVLRFTAEEWRCFVGDETGGVIGGEFDIDGETGTMYRRVTGFNPDGFTSGTAEVDRQQDTGPPGLGLDNGGPARRFPLERGSKASWKNCHPPSACNGSSWTRYPLRPGRSATRTRRG